jgi:phosphopantothenoylcysteine decarboxylase/phosphopantothenate--cysteine ligase
VLRGKKILLGITGSIAAYKSILLVRELIKLGAEVQVICTPSALDFVTPITLSTLSKKPLLSDFVTDKKTGEWANHVDLGKWADLMVIAPLSANTLGKMVTGICDNLLMATYLSADCPVMVAPAMDLDMYKHITTSENINALLQRGVQIIEPGEGELASGLVGKGRMAEPEEIAQIIEQNLLGSSPLIAKKIVITAGPTYERIDPVRFIGNYSTGKMGYAIAESALSRGADVTLISGPSRLQAPEGVKFVSVESANEMFNAVEAVYSDCDALIMSAAVADFKPKNTFESKQKKASSSLNTIELIDTVDILKYSGEKKVGQKLIGFALETDNELENARLKLQNKNLDMLVLNSLNDKGAGFGTDTNKVTFVFNNHEVMHELKSKREVANDIIDALEKMV